MACPEVGLRTDLLIGADESGSWVYNGYSSTFDGDDDNLAQFVGSPASPPEETGAALVGDDPTIDPTGHTIGFYSFTYTLTSGGCSADNNVVLPIMQDYTAGDDVTKTICSDDASIFNLFDLIDNFGTNGVDTGGTWVQLNGTPNPHPGFYNPADPTLATFDVSYIDYPNDTFPLQFYFTTQEPSVSGFETTRCPQCSADHSLVSITMSGATCCDGIHGCMDVSIPDGYTIYLIQTTTSTIDNTSDGMNFPYTLPGDNTAFETDFNNYLTNNGGGTCTVTAASPVGFNLVEVDYACELMDLACYSADCVSYFRFSTGTC